MPGRHVHCEQTKSRMATFGLPCQLSVVTQWPYTGQRSWPYPPLSLLKGTIVPLQRVINCFSYKDATLGYPWFAFQNLVRMATIFGPPCGPQIVVMQTKPCFTWKRVGISSLDNASKSLWEVEESRSLFTKPLLHKIFQHFLFQKKMRTKYEYLNKIHLVLLQHIFPNHGEDVVSNCTDEAALKEEEKIW